MIGKAERIPGPGWAICAFLLLWAPGVWAADPPGLRMAPATVSARGDQRALLSVDAFGRYGVTVRSAQGVGLQALDRMAGLGPVSGEPGKRDGRLDLFLEKGETRILTRGAKAASGEAQLTVTPFQELNSRPPLLVEQRWEQASLGDFQQRSYWLDIPKETTVALEAAGRHLADLRLWRDGTWLLDSQPEMERNEARPDRPLRVARLVARLQPGLYLLTAYGGPGQAWTESAAEQPFYLRWGVPSLAPVLRQRFVMNELGVARYRVPAGPDYFRLELPVAQTASLQVGHFEADSPFQGGGSQVDISKKSTPPVAEVNWGLGEGRDRLITVRAAPGQPYVLQHFQSSQSFRIRQPGRYWLETLQAGHADDTAGSTAVLTRIPDRGREAYLDDQALDLGPGKTWRRRFNLLGDLTLFVRLPVRGKLGVLAQGIQAKYRLEPFLTGRPANYQAPEWKSGEALFDLDAGLYQLTVRPVNKGIVDLRLDGADPALSDSDWLSAAKQWLGLDNAPDKPLPAAYTPVTAGVRFADLQIDPGFVHLLYLNQQPGVATGLVLRTLPIDLGLALPVNQRAGERLSIPVNIPEAGTLGAMTETGQMVELALSDGRRGSRLSVTPGPLEVTVQAGAAPLAYTLALEPTRLASSTPLPPLPDGRLAQLPDFPVLAPEAPQALNLARGATATLALPVPRAGLYRFESTGLLETGAALRDRVNPLLVEAAGNGVGRNFLIQRYLREGNYQLQVSTRGATQGDLGVEARYTEPRDGGELLPGEGDRVTLETGQALAYWLRVDKAGTYRIQAQGLGENFPMRLEDDQGWPLDLTSPPAPQAEEAGAAVEATPDDNGEPPADETEGAEPAAASEDTPAESTASEDTASGQGEAADEARQVQAPPVDGAGVVPGGDVTLELAPGRYRLLVLPRSVTGRVLTRFDTLPEPRRFQGHGPHRLVLAEPVMHTWKEPDKGQVRISDHWLFTLSAEAETTISLDSGMEANLLDGVERSRRLAHLPAGKAWTGLLPAGKYLLRVRHSRGDNLVDYRLLVSTRELLAGQRRDLPIPARLPLSVGKPGLVLLQSEGGSDVAARLLDAQGRTLAQNDDQSDGWNFQIAQTLAPGRYTLVLEPGGAQSESVRIDSGPATASLPTSVTMSQPREVQEPPLAAGSVEIRDRRVHVYPLVVPAGANYLLVGGDAASQPGLVLEGEGSTGWVTLGVDQGRGARLFLPLADGFKAYRLRAWSAQSRASPVRLRVQTGTLPAVSEAAWLTGQGAAVAMDPSMPGLGATLVELSRPGLFRIGSEGTPWQWSDSPERVAATADTPLVSVNGPRLWLLTRDATAPLGAERVVLPGAGVAPLHVTLASGQTARVDLPDGLGGPFLVRADARGGQPGLALGEGRPLATAGLAPGQAVAVALVPRANDPGPLTLWNASQQITAEVDLGLVKLQASPSRSLAPGLEAGTLAPGQALPLALPRGGKTLDLTLGAGVAAVLVKEGRVLATHWSGTDALGETLASDADQLWLLNGADADAPYALELATGTAPPPPLGPGGLVQHNPAGAGRLRIPVAAAEAGLGLHVRGAEQVWWQEEGGGLQSGNDFQPRAAGALWLWHKPGPLVVWREGIPPLPDGPSREITHLAPQTLALDGAGQWLAMKLPQPAMVHLRSETALVSQFLLPGQPARTDAHLHGTRLNLVLPGGEARLGLRPLGAASLSGNALLQVSPATPMAEGLGSDVLLAPGAARLFSFELARETTVGIGIRASADVVRGRLYDQRGALLSEGVVHMPRLPAGRYFLAIDNPADAPPVVVSPVLLGSLTPDLRPPLAVLRRYIEAPDDAPGLLYVPPEAGGEGNGDGREPDEPLPADAGQAAEDGAQAPD